VFDERRCRGFLLKIKSLSEIPWINKVDEISQGNFAVVPWQREEIKGINW